MFKKKALTSHELYAFKTVEPYGTLNGKKIFTTHISAYESMGLNPETGEPIESEQSRKLRELKKLAGELGYDLLEDSAGNPKPVVRAEDEPEAFPFADGGDKSEGGLL